MTTTDFDFQQTRNEIIERAFRIVGVHSTGQALSGEMAVQGTIALNALVKQWQAKSIFLWTITEDSITLPSGDTSIALDNSIIGLDKVWYRDSNDADQSISLISYRDYQSIIDKTSSTSDSPTYAAINYVTSTPTLYIWPKASDDIDVHFLAVKQLQDLDSAGSYPQIPQRFINALTYGLADLLADEYGTNLQERQHLRNKALAFFQEALVSDYEYEDVTMVKSAFDIED